MDEGAEDLLNCVSALLTALMMRTTEPNRRWESVPALRIPLGTTKPETKPEGKNDEYDFGNPSPPDS